MASPSVLLGIALCAALAFLALMASRWTGAPLMLLVLGLGIAVRQLWPGPVARAAPGIAFSSTQLLRGGVALLGFRVMADDLMALGWPALLLVLMTVAGTLGGGFLIARVARLPKDLAAVTATSVAICGASAALAASAAVPRRAGLDRETALVVLLVSLLGTAAMIAYPLLARLLGLAPDATALLIGAAIHDVAQVAGAGFVVSEEVGVRAVTVKMIRVACLLPAIMVLAFLFLAADRRMDQSGKRWRVIRPPTFLVLFFAFAVLASSTFLPAEVATYAGQAAAFLLASAVAAIGLKTGIGDLAAAGPRLALALVAQTLWQLALVVVLILLLFS